MMQKDADYEKVKEEAVATLQKIDPFNPYGTLLYNAIARVSVNVGIEVFVFREIGLRKKSYVWMVQRAADDPFWSNQWHCPGSIIRPKEEIKDVFQRLTQSEFLTPFKNKPSFKGIFNHSDSLRGHELALVYTVELTGEPKNGQWFPVKHLPSNTIEHHRNSIIPLAVSKYGMKQIWVRDKNVRLPG